MAIKIAISLTALSLIQIGMAEVWDRKGSAPNVGQDRQAHYLFIPHHCRITARWVGRGVVARLYRHIRKPLMPIRYPLAFRGTARPSVCSAWRLKVPKIELLTHPKTLYRAENSVLCRNLLIVSALFAQAETLAFRGTWSGCASA